MRKTVTTNKNDKIFIVSQSFYGNRTGTEIEREYVDHFFCGYIDDHAN